MKLWKVEPAKCGMEEYDAFVIWAKDSEEAIKIAIETSKESWSNNFAVGATATEIVKPKKSGLLLGSFNAG